MSYFPFLALGGPPRFFLTLPSNRPAQVKLFFYWLAVAPCATCFSYCLVSVVIAETVSNVLHFSVVGITSSFSFGFIPTIAAILSVKDVLFV